MSVYSVDKLISQARQLAADYRRATGKVLPGVSGEIAEHDAAEQLKLTLVEDRSCGWDAVGDEDGPLAGERVLLKGRTIFDESKSGQRIGQLKTDKDWDALILVLMDEEYQSYEIYHLPREEVDKAVDQTSAARRKRGALSIARARIVGRLLWTREFGLEPEDEVWDNMAGS